MLYDKRIVSIHAPTKGATNTDLKVGLDCMVSIHAPTKGATRIIAEILYKQTCFNPRSHEGSDLKANMRIVGATEVSIHAPTKGATKLYQS